jgi:regulator of sigma E protease
LGSGVTTILAFFFVLGVLVFVHEFGHFLVARLYGVRVITFSLGFGPKLVKVRRGETEYCISAVPLGGYVKLAGETVEDERTGAPDEFMSKSKWIRFQVYLAGPVMNLTLAILLLAGVLTRGADVALYTTATPVIGSVATGSVAEKAGLRVGDRVESVDGRPIATWDELELAVMPKANREVEVGVVRDGQRRDLRVTPAAFGKFEIGSLGIGPVLRPQITTVLPNGAAERAGLLRGDVIVAIDGVPGMGQPDVIKQIRKSGGVTLRLTIERAGEARDVPVVPDKSGATGAIGAMISPWEVRRLDPNLFQAVGLSVKQNWDTTVQIGRSLKGLFTAETPVRQLMGPVAIAELSGSAAQLGWLPLLEWMAMLSLNLGLLNLMPVPVLDGGHIAILGFEGLSRRDLSVRVKERILLAGAALIVLLMVTVIYNDVARLLR